MPQDTEFEGEPIQHPGGNPKHEHGLAKAPMYLAPASARIQMALAFKDGARKYGPYNWRETGGIAASVYFSAMQRHIDAWFDGEDRAVDSGVHHLGHAMACAAILLDAMEIGGFVDDRPPPGTAAELQRTVQEPMVTVDGNPDKVRQPSFMRDGIRDFLSHTGRRIKLVEWVKDRLDAGEEVYLYAPPNRVLAWPRDDIFEMYRKGVLNLLDDVSTGLVDAYSVKQEIGNIPHPPAYLGVLKGWTERGQE